MAEGLLAFHVIPAAGTSNNADKLAGAHLPLIPSYVWVFCQQPNGFSFCLGSILMALAISTSLFVFFTYIYNLIFASK